MYCVYARERERELNARIIIQEQTLNFAFVAFDEAFAFRQVVTLEQLNYAANEAT